MSSTLAEFPAIAPPEPGLTPTEIIARAAAMRERLRERHAESDAARRILQATHDEFVDAGFYRMLQPRHFGGYEFDVPTFVRVMIELARGCPGSAWTAALTAGHVHVLAKYPLRAQSEVYGPDGEFRAALRQVDRPPVNRVRVVEGGYVVNGYWDYASGCDVGTHFFGGSWLSRNVKLEDAPQIPSEHVGEAELLMLFDRRDYEIVDNWDTLGMRASGSRRVVVRDAFVPWHRAELFNWIIDGVGVRRPPWKSPFPNAMYVGPSSPLFDMEIGAVAIGNGLGALDAYEQMLRAKFDAGAYARPDFAAWSKRVFGEASSLVATGESALMSCARDYMEFCEQAAAGESVFDSVREQTFILIVQQCVRLVAEAVDLLFRAGGTSASKSGAALGRYFRDMSTLRTHVAFQFDMDWELWTQRRLKLRRA